MKIKKKNPTDKELLKKIKIKKIIRQHYCYYYIFLNNQKIGEASVPIKYEYSYINIIEIDEKFRRKGLAIFLYNYIEKDLQVKLKPSEDLELNGAKFWENRLKKKNPTDLEFLKKVKIEKEVFNIENKKDKIISILYTVFYENKKIGCAELVKGQNYVDDVFISENFRRKGVTTFLYNYIEKDLKIKLKSSKLLQKDGLKFWDNRNKLEFSKNKNL